MVKRIIIIGTQRNPRNFMLFFFFFFNSAEKGDSTKSTDRIHLRSNNFSSGVTLTVRRAAGLMDGFWQQLHTEG